MTGNAYICPMLNGVVATVHRSSVAFHFPSGNLESPSALACSVVGLNLMVYE